MTILVSDYFFDRMQSNHNPGGSGLLPQTSTRETMSIGAARRSSSSSSSSNSGGRMGKRPGKKPGRKPSKIDEHAKLERSRQSARECRARKKLRYQYLEELVLNREKAVFALRDELETFKQWCLQLDQGGDVPEPLLKMIVNEDVTLKRRQLDEASRSLQQQQQQQQQQLQQRLISSSSSSSNSPPCTTSMALQQQQEQPKTQRWHQHQQLPHNVTTAKRDAFQAAHQQVLPVTSADSYLSNVKSEGLSETDVKFTPPLIRQMAIDLPQDSSKPIQSFAHSSQGFPPQEMQQQRTPASTTDVMFSSSQRYPPQGTSSNAFFSKSTETPLKYQHSQDSLFAASASPAVRAAIASNSSRLRSFSNPITMARKPLQDTKSNINVDYPLTPRTVSQLSGASQHHSLFSGNTPDSSSLALPVRLDQSSSSDDNMNPSMPMFAALQQKRTLSDPNLLIQHNTKSLFTAARGLDLPLASLARRPTTNQFAPISTTETGSLASPMYDPQTMLSNLTTVNCFSNTRTSNTPSPAPYSLIPVGTGTGATTSPTPSVYQPSTTPSSTSTSSSGPLLSLNSFLELASSVLPSASDDIVIDDRQTGDLAVPNFLFSQQTPTAQCSSTGLSASISEPIPEWYSFLADLQGGEASLTSRHGASSSQGTPIALTPKPADQPPTPDSSSSSFLNVPNIIDEFLDKPADT